MNHVATIRKARKNRHKPEPESKYAKHKQFALRMLIMLGAIALCLVTTVLFNIPIGLDRTVEMVADALGESVLGLLE